MTKDRYHHGQLRQALLDAAETLAGERGAEGWSLREVSAQLGVAPSAAYHHFTCREELVSKLAERIQADVGQRLSRAVARADTTDPMQALIAYARTYVRWTIDNRGLAALAFAAASHIDKPETASSLALLGPGCVNSIRRNTKATGPSPT